MKYFGHNQVLVEEASLQDNYLIRYFICQSKCKNIDRMCKHLNDVWIKLWLLLWRKTVEQLVRTQQKTTTSWRVQRRLPWGNHIWDQEWVFSSARKEKRCSRQWKQWVVTAFCFQELTECKCKVENRGCLVPDDAGQKGNDYKFRSKATMLRILILTPRIVKSHWTV